MQKRKKIYIKILSIIIFIVASFLFFDDMAVAASACDGKAKGTQCTTGDGHSVEPGECDGNGVCVSVSKEVNSVFGKGGSGGIESDIIPGVTEGESQFIKCGRQGQRMCTLCDLIAGLNLVIQFIMRISIGIGILAFAAAGVMYVLSAGSPDLKGKANSAMTNSAIGFAVILSAWLIVNTIILMLGAKTDNNGNATFGINITGWGQFECEAKNR